VTPAVVERTVARYGVHGILTERERETLAAFAVERRRRDWLAGRVAAVAAVRRVLAADELARLDGDEAPPSAIAL
jgi:4'-phosphopantetheinyl transferase EntD